MTDQSDPAGQPAPPPAANAPWWAPGGAGAPPAAPPVPVAPVPRPPETERPVGAAPAPGRRARLAAATRAHRMSDVVGEINYLAVLLAFVAFAGLGTLYFTGARHHLLTGTQPLSFPQIAVVPSDVLRRRVRPVPVSAPVLYAGIRAGGGSHWQARGMVAPFHDVARRGPAGVRVHSTDLVELTGRATTDMTAFVTAHAAGLS